MAAELIPHGPVGTPDSVIIWIMILLAGLLISSYESYKKNHPEYVPPIEYGVKK